MKNEQVGRIKNLQVNDETQELELTFIITDAKFKKKILRDLSLAGQLTIEKDILIFLDSEETDA